jgi:DNA mismatch repair protein MutH
MAVRMTTQEVFTKIQQILKTNHVCAKTTNKGGAGIFLEKLIGIPQTSACCDMIDGELKVFPLNKKGKSKESCAITMVDKDYQTTKFEDSRVFKKLQNTLFVAYERKDDTICFTQIIHFTKEHPYFEQIKEDYAQIQQKSLSSSVGTYLQTRTKGAGHGSKSRAFYLRASFMNKLLN